MDAATRTLPRKCVTSATIFAMGDGLAQHAFEGRTLREHDYRRTARMSFHGGVGEWPPWCARERTDGHACSVCANDAHLVRAHWPH